jgi:transcriptional repressor NrdR
MLCPYCHSDSSRVVDKRDNNETGVTRRRRECLECKKRYTTYERIENIHLNVEKRSGKLEEFDREKLKRGIFKAVKKRPISENKIDDMIDDIELKLLNRKKTTVKSTDIGKMVLTRLKKVDKLGYILFAAVYNEYENLDELKHELDDLNI